MTAWLQNVTALNVRLTTWQKYQSHFKKQIVPYLGEVKVQELA